MSRRLPLGIAVLAVLSLTLTDLGPASADTSPTAVRPSQAAPPTNGTAAGTRAGSAASTGSGGVVAPVPTLRWQPCQYAPGLRCTRARVPLDYDRPDGPTIRLRLAMRKAHPLPGQHKIGTLFVNPGGPGGPASDVPDDFAQLLGPAVQRRFDVVGIDPRGVGGSAPVRCHISAPAPPFFPHAFPMTSRENRQVIRFNGYLRRSCREGGNPILDHMTTADTARDMDLIRQAVGEDRLTYYGVSYGTYLGATYARLFPHRVRAIITDGVLDPVAWSTGRHGTGRTTPFSTRLRSGRGAAEALLSALAVCDKVGKRRCAFAGHARGKWRRMTSRLRRGPVRLSDGSLLRYADLVGGVLGGLYSRTSYQPMMRDLRRLYAQLGQPGKAAETGTADVRAADRLAGRVRDLPYSYGPSFWPAFEGVACADTLNPTNPYAWVRAANASEKNQPWFGRSWTWASGACPRWPGSHADAFRGPWRVKTSAPVLIVGNRHDPATPISGAWALHRAFANSRLFRLNGWGHGAVGESRCVTRTFAAYLVHGTLPAGGTVCLPDRGLFPVRHH